MVTMENLAQLTTQSLESVFLFLPRLAGACLILLGAFYAGRMLARAIGLLMAKISGMQIHDTFFRSLIRLMVFYFGIVLALNVLGMEKLALSLLAGGGVTAIVLGFAFREIGENFLAGIFLAFSRPFNVGDLINSEGLEGRVKSIALRFTHLRAVDGRDIYVPSSQLFSKPVINYTRDGLRRFSFSVGIDYANDAKAACHLLEDAVGKIAGVLEEPSSAATIDSLEPGYVELSVSYWQNVFDEAVDGKQLRINVIDSCRKVLLENNYTVSADTTSNVAVSGKIESP